jgi:hypothetical protein
LDHLETEPQVPADLDLALAAWHTRLADVATAHRMMMTATIDHLNDEGMLVRGTVFGVLGSVERNVPQRIITPFPAIRFPSLVRSASGKHTIRIQCAAVLQSLPLQRETY